MAIANTANEDLAQILRTLEEWAGKIPQDAREFHSRRLALARQIRDSTGTFGGRDQNQIAEILRKFHAMEGDLPAMLAMIAAVGRARNKVTEFRAAPAPDSRTQAQVEEWSKDWLNLMEFLVGRAADRDSAEKAASQMATIETWAEERRSALAILAKAAALRRADASPSLRAAADSAFGFWMADFGAQRIDARWVAAAGETVRKLAAELAAQAATQVRPASAEPDRLQTRPPSVPLPVSPKPAAASQPAPVRQAPDPPPAAEQPTEREESRIHFRRIGAALAECVALAEALKEPLSEIEKIEVRYWDAYNRQHMSPGDANVLEREIEVYRGRLLQRAAQEVERRLTRLRERWLCFKSVYDNRTDIAAMIAEAEGAKPAGAHGVREFLATVDGAEQRIYAIVNANRPKLAAHLGKTAEHCGQEVAGLRAQARLIRVDLALNRLRIPEMPDGQVNAEQLFERLDQCHAVLAEIDKLSRENEAKQAEIRTRMGELKHHALQIAAGWDAPEAATLAREIPERFVADRTLDAVEAELQSQEDTLKGQIAKVRRYGGDTLSRLRRENQLWSRLLGPITLDIEKLAAGGPVPEDLEELRAALDAETQLQQHLAELTVLAARQLAQRGAATFERLRHHLESPAFETHPERDTAETLLGELQSVQFREAPQRDEFSDAQECVESAEDFIDRIEAANRKIPERLTKLEESFAWLRELNAISYRDDLARRINLLLMGARRGIALEQWEHLPMQLDQAEILLAALRRDSIRRISSETGERVESLEQAVRNSGDAALARQIQSMLQELEEQGHFEPPTFSMRQRLARLERKTPAGARK
jgi:hypothetical protein